MAGHLGKLHRRVVQRRPVEQERKTDQLGDEQRGHHEQERPREYAEPQIHRRTTFGSNI